MVRLLSRKKGRAGFGERIAARTGAVLGGATSLYLALLWRQEGRREVEWWAIAAGIAVIAGAGWLVGWLMRAGALVVVAASGGHLAKATRARGWLPLVLGAVIASLALAGGGLLAPRARPARPIPSLSPVPAPGRLVVVGLDGVEREWLQSMLARAGLPAFERIASGSASWSIRPDPSPLPPEIWTTYATGQPGDVHGVRSFEVRRLPGMRAPLAEGTAGAPFTATVLSSLRLLAFLAPEIPPEPLNSGLRRAPALWEILGASGIPSGVVDWWGTWPASAEGGLTVSDRAFGAFRFRMGDEAGRAAGAASGGEGEKDQYEGLAFPPALQRELIAEFPSRLEGIEEDLRTAVQGDPPDGGSPEMREAFLIDAYHLGVARLLLEERPVKALFVYLPGEDILMGSLLASRGGGPGREGPAGGLMGSAIRSLKEQEILLHRIDEGLSRLIAEMAPADLLVVIADPGRFSRSDLGGRARGQIFLFGERVVGAGAMGEIGALDVAPTLLSLAGLPSSHEMPGQAIQNLRSIVTGPLGEGSVPTFGDRVEKVQGMDHAEEVLDRLRSLGYIQ